MKKELVIGIAIGSGAVALFAGPSASSLLFAALILACPLMMLFMGHGAGHGSSHDSDTHDSHRSEDPVNEGKWR